MSSLSLFRDRLGGPRALIGVIHVGALPGTPAVARPLDALVADAVAESRIYRDEGFTALAIENTHDRPYLRGGVGPEVVAAMTAIASAIRREVALPLGVQILAGANREALAVAHATGADFVRVEGFVFAHVADEGLIQSSAADLLRYRRQIGAERVLVLADIKKKHSAHAITADVTIAETAEAAEFFLVDGVIVSGAATGLAASPDEVRAVAGAVHLPVLVGSGVTPENLPQFAAATGFIVGSSVKRDGRWDRPLERERVRAVVEAWSRLPPVNATP
jgi:membrane complex biogenesis BtpA family protein